MIFHQTALLFAFFQIKLVVFAVFQRNNRWFPQHFCRWSLMGEVWTLWRSWALPPWMWCVPTSHWDAEKAGLEQEHIGKYHLVKPMPYSYPEFFLIFGIVYYWVYHMIMQNYMYTHSQLDWFDSVEKASLIFLEWSNQEREGKNHQGKMTIEHLNS